jgi:hypothetical protein
VIVCRKRRTHSEHQSDGGVEGGVGHRPSARLTGTYDEFSRGASRSCGRVLNNQYRRLIGIIVPNLDYAQRPCSPKRDGVTDANVRDGSRELPGARQRVSRAGVGARSPQLRLRH